MIRHEVLGPFTATRWHVEKMPGEPRTGWRGLLDRILRRDPPTIEVTVIDEIEPPFSIDAVRLP